MAPYTCLYCSASFVSNDLLARHFEEYRSRAVELENCRAHANANENADNANENANETETAIMNDESYISELVIRKNTRCPFEGCKRKEPFERGQQLRVHARIHVPCEEVCVICFKVFRWTSEYIRHAREHPNPSQTKRQYTEKICSELRGQSNKELEKALKKFMGPPMEPILGKRTWGAASLETDSAKDCREPNNALPLASDLMPPLAPVQNMDTFIPTQASYPLTEDDHIFDPPLFTTLNFPNYPPLIDANGWYTNAPSDFEYSATV